jgi:DNA-binding GntR family transcriptional regulator
MAEPMYRVISENLRNKIKPGELAEGSQPATHTELREQYEASQNTVRDAIKCLRRRTRPGSSAPRRQKDLCVRDHRVGLR